MAEEKLALNNSMRLCELCLEMRNNHIAQTFQHLRQLNEDCIFTPEIYEGNAKLGYDRLVEGRAIHLRRAFGGSSAVQWAAFAATIAIGLPLGVLKIYFGCQNKRDKDRVFTELFRQNDRTYNETVRQNERTYNETTRENNATAAHNDRMYHETVAQNRATQQHNDRTYKVAGEQDDMTRSRNASFGSSESHYKGSKWTKTDVHQQEFHPQDRRGQWESLSDIATQFGARLALYWVEEDEKAIEWVKLTAELQKDGIFLLEVEQYLDATIGEELDFDEWQSLAHQLGERTSKESVRALAIITQHLSRDKLPRFIDEMPKLLDGFAKLLEARVWETTRSAEACSEAQEDVQSQESPLEQLVAEKLDRTLERETNEYNESQNGASEREMLGRQAALQLAQHPGSIEGSKMFQELSVMERGEAFRSHKKREYLMTEIAPP
ncbi:MAG: hypothetical protein LQ342_008340 [Letrouitia transgressa]|nr:MAG: hypothetical protein LQ342_008340 [Letrouitia transgressa]